MKVRSGSTFWILFLVAAGARCTGDSTPAVIVEPVVVASVSVAPTGRSIFAGQSMQLSATALDAQGKTIEGKTVAWSSNNSAIATVGSDGAVTGVSFGSATISATIDGVAGTVTIAVLHDPVVFMHGFQASAAIWTTMIDRLKADGWTDAPLVTWTYDSNQSNVTIAQQLQVKVDSLLGATGAKRIDIIAHSMGGLSSRYYAKNLAGSAKIDAFVSLGTPNHGTTIANFCPVQSCIEMRSGSAFLNALNADDETPGSPKYATWWTPCDQVTTPAESATLSGATNTKTACLAHSDLYLDATVYAQVRDWIR